MAVLPTGRLVRRWELAFQRFNIAWILLIESEKQSTEQNTRPSMTHGRQNTKKNVISIMQRIVGLTEKKIRPVQRPIAQLIQRR